MRPKGWMVNPYWRMYFEALEAARIQREVEKAQMEALHAAIRAKHLMDLNTAEIRQ